MQRLSHRTIRFVGFAAVCWAALLVGGRTFAGASPQAAALHQDRQGLFIKTRNADAFYRLLNRLVIENGINVESVSPVDDDLNAVYHYLIGSNGGGQV